MNKKGKALIVGLTLAAMTGTAFAAGPGYGFGKNVNCPGYGDRLNLTQEQRTNLNELKERNWKDTVALRNEMQTKRLELRTLWSAPDPDRSKILAKQKELNALRDQLQAKLTDSRLEARKILTPEQAAQIGTFRGGMGFRGMGRARMGGQGYGPCGGFGGGGPRF